MREINRICPYNKAATKFVFYIIINKINYLYVYFPILQDLKHQESIPTEKGINLSAEQGRHLCHKNTGECVCNIFYWANIKSSHINQTLKRHLEDLRIQKINSGVQRLLTPPSIRAAMNNLKVSRLLPRVVKKTEFPKQELSPCC